MIRLNKDELSLNLRQAEQAFADASTNYDRIKTLYRAQHGQPIRNTIRLTSAWTTPRSPSKKPNSISHTQMFTAPIAGVVTQRLVEVGDLVRGNQEVFRRR